MPSKQVMDTLIQEGSMCEGAMQCNEMPGGVEMASSSRGHSVSGFSKQCMHLKQARNNARQETSQGSNLEKSSEVYFHSRGPPKRLC